MNNLKLIEFAEICGSIRDFIILVEYVEFFEHYI